MSREARTISLTILTLFMYGLASFMQHGVFIFPLPILEFLFLGIVVFFAAFHFKQAKTDYLLMLVLGISQVCAKDYNWGLFLDTETMIPLSESFLTDSFQLLFYACVLLGMVRFFVVNRLQKYAWSCVLSVGIYVYGVAFQLSGVLFSGLLIFVGTQGLLFLQKPDEVARTSKSIYYLWLLLLVMEGIALLNLYA